MKLRAALVATTLLYGAPALAAIDPPAATTADTRIRSLVYDPNNPVKVYTAPGMSLRIEFGADETVVDGGIVVSDQDTIAPDPSQPPPIAAASTGPLGAQGPKIPSTCDMNLCRSVSGNIVYLKPVRPLDPQPLFIQTTRKNAKGVDEMVSYVFEFYTVTLSTDELNHPVFLDKNKNPIAMVWGIHFSYPERTKQAQVAAWQKQHEIYVAQERDQAALAHPVAVAALADCPSLDGKACGNYHYGYRGSAEVQPDHAWDDGRSTYLRFEGNRQLPNVYSLLPDGTTKSIPATSTAPDEHGNTMTIAGTGTKWFLWYGEGQQGAGCLFNLGPDPEGRTATTVAMQQPAPEHPPLTGERPVR